MQKKMQKKISVITTISAEKSAKNKKSPEKLCEEVSLIMQINEEENAKKSASSAGVTSFWLDFLKTAYS